MTRSCLSGIIHGEAGSQVAEAALVLPLMFTILLGIFWFGQAFSIYGTLTHAARQGARAAVAPACATCGGTNDPSTNAYNAIQSALQAAKLDPNKLQKPSTLPGLCACGSSNTSCTGGGVVRCDGGQSKICVQGVSRVGNGPPDVDSVQLSSASGGGAGVCGLSVSFLYPYSFWLPGTSLNKRQILLRAQAEMRVETQ
jgi:Flp pilus assembly protein TadG